MLILELRMLDDEMLCDEVKNLCGILQGKTLDVGCGSGDIERCLLERGIIKGELVGIDLWDFSLRYVEQNLLRYGITIKCLKMSAERLDFPDAIFDNYLSIRMFHEIDNPVKALKESYRVLKPSGTCLIIDWKKGADTGVPERYYSLSELTSLIKSATAFKVVSAEIKDDYLFIKCKKL